MGISSFGEHAGRSGERFSSILWTEFTVWRPGRCLVDVDASVCTYKPDERDVAVHLCRVCVPISARNAQSTCQFPAAGSTRYHSIVRPEMDQKVWRVDEINITKTDERRTHG